MSSLFWVGGTNTWNGTAGTKWATTSGGTGGAPAPTTADDVFFDANSGSGTVTTLSSVACRSLNCTGFTGTISHPAGITLSLGDATAGAGNIALKLVSGMTYSLGSTTTSAINFVSTSTTQQTVDFGGKNVGNITFNGAGGSWQMVSGITMVATATLTLTAGSLDINGQTCSIGIFNGSGSTTRSLSLGAASITITGTGTSWNFGTVTGLTFNAGTSTITATGNSPTISAGTLTYATVVIAPTAVSGAALGGGATFGNLSFLPAAGVDLMVTVTGSAVVTGTFTSTGALSAAPLQGKVLVCRSNPSNGSATGITAAAVSLSHTNFMDIAAAGAAIPWSGTAIGDAGGNSNINFDVPRTLYWVANSGSGSWTNPNKWSLSTGGSTGNSCPLPQDNVFFDANSFNTTGLTVTANTRVLGKSIDMSAVTNAPTLSHTVTNIIVCGNLIYAPTLTLSGTGSIVLGGRSNYTFNPNGANIAPTQFSVNVAAGSYTLASDLTILNTLNLFFGTFDAGGHNVQCSSFASANSNVRALTMGTGTWTITGANTIWNVSTATNLTLSAASATIAITDTSATNKTFTHNAVATFGNITITGGGTGSVIIGGSSRTVNNFTCGAPKTVTLGSATTMTINGLFTVVGSSGNVITLNATTAGNQATISKTSGVVSCDYLSIQDSTATGGAYWAAGDNSTNVSGNSGWVFGAATFALSVSDSVTMSDQIAKSVGKKPADSISTSDSIAKAIGIGKADTVTLTESIAKAIGKKVNDGFTMSDQENAVTGTITPFGSQPVSLSVEQKTIDMESGPSVTTLYSN